MLLFSVEPRVTPYHFDQNGVNAQTSIRVLCAVVVGDTPINIKWFKNGQEIWTGMSAVIQKLDDMTSMLSLHHINVEDSGNYTCVATNAAGSASHSSQLKVKGI